MVLFLILTHSLWYILTIIYITDKQRKYKILFVSYCIFFSDPNVDVIYVAPVPINEEMAQYYSKLLGLKFAIDSGNVEDQGDVTDRYKIITPEAVKSFPVSIFFFFFFFWGGGVVIWYNKLLHYI